MDIIEALNWRYATKIFDKEKRLSEAQLTRLLESLRLSASSFGLQPWKFVVVEDVALRKELVGYSWKQTQVVDASHLLVLCRLASMDTAYIDRFLQDTAEKRGAPIESLQGYRDMMMSFFERMDEAAIAAWMYNQIYLALGNLLTVCGVEGIDVCPMEGFSAPDFDRILKLEEQGLRSVVLCPVGFRAVDDKYATLPKIRYPIEDVVVKV